MKSFAVHLLQDQSVQVGVAPHCWDLLVSFHTSGIDRLDHFLQTTATEVSYLESAFGYWVLCALGRCQEDKSRYGLLVRTIVNHSPKLWKQLRSEASKMAIKIKNFQKRQFLEAS